VGLTGLEPVTLRLSSACSNQLSYRPGYGAKARADYLRLLIENRKLQIGQEAGVDAYRAKALLPPLKFRVINSKSWCRLWAPAMLRPALFVAISFALAVCASADQPDSVASSDGWKFTSEKGGIKIFSRPHHGSPVKEFRAIGDIEACSREVHAVIDDIDGYPSFMPYMAECQLVKREADSLLIYQRISPKIVCDRDYTLRIWETSSAGPDGFTFLNRWQAANALGPAKKPGVMRVQLCNGSWLLEPSSKTTTKATYSVCSDSCGKAPAFIANQFSLIGIREVFAAVRQRVKNPKYSVAQQGEIRIGKRQVATD
jgi:hypothetical protein